MIPFHTKKIIMLKKHTYKNTPNIHINPIHTEKQHLRVTILINNHHINITKINIFFATF